MDGAISRMEDFVLSGGHATTTEEVKRPTGQQLFDSLSKEKQDEMLGPAAAEKVRSGEATLADFVEKDGGFIRQKPVEDL